MSGCIYEWGADPIRIDVGGCCDGDDCPFRDVEADDFLETLHELHRMAVQTFTVRAGAGNLAGVFASDREH
jgi:hypothetical protein